MAASTCCRVESTTPGKPFETRETVCADTPASFATSPMDAPRLRRAPSAAGSVREAAFARD